MVFYNKILRAYVLIELKTTKLTPEAAGQLNMYLNYYAAEVNDEHDNPPIGIILCTDKDSIAAEYALGGLSNNIFASRYVSYIPNKEQFIAYHTVTFNVTIYAIDLLYLSRNSKKIVWRGSYGRIYKITCWN